MTIVAKEGTIPRQHLFHDGKSGTGPDGPVVQCLVRCANCLMEFQTAFTYTVFRTWACPNCELINAWWPLRESVSFYVGFFESVD